MNPTAPGLARGERAPDFVLPCQDGTPVRFYARAGGHPAVLLFCNTVVADELLHFSALIETLVIAKAHRVQHQLLQLVS